MGKIVLSVIVSILILGVLGSAYALDPVFLGDFVVQIGSIIGGKTLTGFGGNPSLNNNGDVAFRGLFSGGEGIFTQNSLIAEIGDGIGGKTFTSVADPSINNNGDVAFSGGFSGGSGITIASKACDLGTLQVGFECVPDPATQISCGEGTHVENFICVITKSPRLGWDFLRTFLGFN